MRDLVRRALEGINCTLRTVAEDLEYFGQCSSPYPWQVTGPQGCFHGSGCPSVPDLCLTHVQVGEWWTVWTNNSVGYFLKKQGVNSNLLSWDLSQNKQTVYWLLLFQLRPHFPVLLLTVFLDSHFSSSQSFSDTADTWQEGNYLLLEGFYLSQTLKLFQN